MTTKTQAHSARYRNEGGKIVPSVTTITGTVGKPQLIHAAWKLGIEGEDYKEVWGEQAKIGSVSHNLVESFLKKVEPDLADFTPAQIEVGKFAYQHFPGWWDSEELTLVASECRLVSKVMVCGGTLDIVAETFLQELWLIDVKTSKAIWEDLLYQLAAYWAMWNENYPERPISKAVIIHLNKETGLLTPYHYDNLFKELEIFRHLRMIYGLRKDRDPKGALYRLSRKFNLERI